MSEQTIETGNSRRARKLEAGAETLRAKGNAQPDKVVKSAGRVLRILEFFDARREAASVIDVARALGMPQSSTSVLLRSLTLMGYLDYDSRSRTYRPTSRVAILGNWVNPVLVQRGGVLDTMRELSARAGLTALLTARNGVSVQHIHVVCPDNCASEHQVSGTQPLATSAAGEMFLSLMPELEVSKLIRRINAYAGHTEKVVRVPDLLLRLAETRKRGFVYHAGDNGGASATLAMLIPNARGPLALSLAGSRDQIEGAVDALVAMMRRYIANVTQLGDHKLVHVRQ